MTTEHRWVGWRRDRARFSGDAADTPVVVWRCSCGHTLTAVGESTARPETTCEQSRAWDREEASRLWRSGR